MMSTSFHTTTVVLVYNILDTIGKILASYMTYSNK